MNAFKWKAVPPMVYAIYSKTMKLTRMRFLFLIQFLIWFIFVEIEEKKIDAFLIIMRALEKNISRWTMI